MLGRRRGDAKEKGAKASAKAGAKAIKAVPRAQRKVVFYAESAADWAFLGPVYDRFVADMPSVIRVTSDASDPVLEQPNAFFIGDGITRTVYFKTADADLFVMTLTDLDTMQLKRSVHPVHYAYIFHSIASTHRIYREHAFDHYDTLLCVGPHHVTELRRLEELYGLPKRTLLEHGYARLDVLLEACAALEADPASVDFGPDPEPGGSRVLVAPSWGPTSLVDHGLDAMVASLLAEGHSVTVRLHPMTRRHHPELEGELIARHEPTGRFRFDPNIAATASLVAADTMISEWSGAALDYAFSRLRPVVFVDTPPKINNPNHAGVGLEVFEDGVRSRIGRIVPLDEIGSVGRVASDLVAEADQWATAIERERDGAVFNVGSSAHLGAQHLLARCRDLGITA